MRLPKLNKKQQFSYGFILTLIVVTVIGIGLDYFFDRYDLNFQSPIVIQMPISVADREMVSPLGDSFSQGVE